MGTEGEMDARIKAEQMAKAKAAEERENEARDEASKKAMEKEAALKRVQQEILAERKAEQAAAKPAVKTVTSATASQFGALGMPGIGPVAAKSAGIIAEYTVKKGDTLSKIAREFYGISSPEVWKLIQEANKDLIKDVNLIYPGQVFKIPALPEELKKR